MRLTRRGTARLLAGACAAAFAVQPITAHADARRQALVDDALAAAKKVIESSDFPDAPRMLRDARAVLIVPNMVQGGFIIGAAGGRGVLLTRTGPGDWSYRSESASSAAVFGTGTSALFTLRCEPGHGLSDLAEPEDGPTQRLVRDPRTDGVGQAP